MKRKMRNYLDLLEELKQHGIEAQDGEFYDYRDFPLETDFNTFYEFCQTYLDRDDLGFDIKPARFYYNSNINVNGLAYVKNDFKLVEIYKGTIFGLKDFFDSKKELFSGESLLKYNQLTLKNASEPEYFLFQYVTLYFLYHEVGHLIQRSMGSTNHKEFVDTKCEGDDIITQHIREHDADWFAANQVAFHIISFANQISEPSLESKKTTTEDIASLSLAGIYMYFIRRTKAYPQIYYQEHCHPHPSVRLSYMIYYLMDALSENLPFVLNKGSVLTNAIAISESLMMEPERNIIKEYSLQLYAEIKKVEDYIKQIRKNSEGYPYLSRKLLNP